MRVVWGARRLVVVADKSGITIVDADGKTRICVDRDHGSKSFSVVAFHPSLPYVALAATNGNVQLLDVEDGKVHQKFNIDDTCSGLGFSSKSLFTASKVKGEVIEWSIESGKELSRFVADEEGLTALSVYEESDEFHPLIATARTDVCIWKSGKRISRFTGHTSNVSCLSFLKGGALASLSEGDRSINIWPANTKKARRPALTLASPVNLDFVTCGSRLSDGDEAAVLGLSQTDSKAFLWRIPSLSEGSDVQTLQPSTVVATVAEEMLLASDFASESGSLYCLVLVKGDILPVLTIQNVLSASGEGGLLKEIVVKVTTSASLVAISEADAAGTKGSSAKRLDRADIVNKSEGESAKRIRAISMTSAGEDERPMLARLAEFTNRLEQPNSSANAGGLGKLSTPASLTVALEQALQTEDKEKIEAVLQNTDAAIISQTVQRITPLKLPVLIRELASRLQGKPGRAGALLIWINAVLEHHASSMAADPFSRDALRTLYSVADARVQTFDQLLRLKGRLDLLLAYSSATSSTSVGATKKGPLVVFDATKA